MKIKCYSKSLLADLTTPVSLFLRIREMFSQVLLMESSGYSSSENSLSFICFDSLSNYIVKDGKKDNKDIENVVQDLESYMSSFDIDYSETENATLLQQYNGLFGFSSFDAVQYFEKIRFDNQSLREDIPELRYDLFRYIIVFDHFHNRLNIIENCPADESGTLDGVEALFTRKDYQTFDFKVTSEETSPLTDQQYMDMVTKAKSHCKRGDVFQIVLARRYEQEFSGDEFSVYRCLRSINPSPYLFFFDYGSYKLFGSSPEVQIKVTNGEAEIHPIAGTFRRTKDALKDQQLAEALKKDPKENAEHVMLVDLARNDLSKNCTDVQVTKYKMVQFFSHVIHLTSVVKGKLKVGVTAFQIFADTFPAGTLSGAPKYKAMQLIDEYEAHSRTFYGGAIGAIHFNGDLNHAIVIRSFLSQGGKLRYQAGAGLVIDSQEENELQEVKNKLAALKSALIQAEKI